METKAGREDMELARVYVKMQPYGRVWSPMEGLQKGTIFPDLYRPYEPKSPPVRETSPTRRGGRMFG